LPWQRPLELEIGYVFIG